MGRILVPATIVASMAAFAVAALSAGLSAYQPTWWLAAVQLAVLGGIVPMIYAVTIRIVPVFSRRSWPSEGWLQVQVAAAITGAWVVWASQIADWTAGLALGHALALAGGLTHTLNIVRLFRQPAAQTPALPLSDPGQATVDRFATRFTRLAGMYLLVGLAIGAVTSLWVPSTGRWDLVWAHALLVGYFLSMAAGVCYHVLSRWTGRRWRWQGPIRLHLLLVAVGLPIMLVALATSWMPLFAIAGPLQALAVVLFLANIVPMLGGLPARTAVAIALAGTFLLAGVSLGAIFAIEPAIGARLRFVHAELNLFGWTGLLICGVGYYLIPRLLGRPLRWPRLATVQLASLVTGVLLSTAALAWRTYGDASPELTLGAHVLVALGFVQFAMLIALSTQKGQDQRVTVAVPLRATRPSSDLKAGNA